MDYKNNLTYAQQQDSIDPLKDYRNLFYFPKVNGKESIYYTGNSLGLQPKTVRESLQQELDDWANFGVEGHFHAKNPWFSYHEYFSGPLAKIVGALPQEVVAMNQLTVNLHLLMVSFYRPNAKRFKILCEAKAFPSDQYALESQVRFHGFNPDTAIIEISPREGERLINHQDIISKINELGEELALVMIGGVNYFTGQVFDMKSITQAGHKVGALVGFDLAHAAGNIKMNLHDWDVDFATWCSYKYLNSGPGGVSGVYIHEKHAKNKSIPRFAGWWGQNKKTRFLMEKGFDPIESAESWQLSNAPVLSMAAHRASLEIFEKAGMDALCAKRDKLTAYLEFIIQDINSKLEKDKNLEIITPKNLNERGCQLSIIAHGRGKSLFNTLLKEGVISDWREPNVIRVAPAPLYNSFEDAYNFGQILEKALQQTN
jgi:kynureninase